MYYSAFCINCQGGLVVRYGPQDEYAAIIAVDLENKAFLECGSEEGEGGMKEDGDYGAGNEGGETATPDLPKSQLFHFHSPLNWARVVKLEYELVSESPDTDVDGESQNSQDDDLKVDQFPLRNFALVLQGANTSLSSVLKASSFFSHLYFLFSTSGCIGTKISK